MGREQPANLQYTATRIVAGLKEASFWPVAVIRHPCVLRRVAHQIVAAASKQRAPGAVP